MKVISLNTDRRLTSIIKLNHIINRYKPDIITLQDISQTNNRMRNTINQLAYSNYRIQTGGHRNSLWTLTRMNMDIHNFGTITSSDKTNAIFTDIHIQGHMLKIINIYIKPKATYTQVKQLLIEIEEEAKRLTSKTIIAGDLNSSSIGWDADNTLNKETSERHYANIKISRGKEIERFMNKNRLTCINANREHTYISNKGNGSIIDLIIVGDKLLTKVEQIQTITLQEKGHKAILSEIRLTEDCTRKETVRTTHNLKDIQQSDFIEVKLLHKTLSNNWQRSNREGIINRLEKLATIFYNTIARVQSKIARHKKVQSRRIKFNNRTKNHIIKLRKLEDRHLQKRRNNTTSKSRIKKLKTKIMNDLQRNHLGAQDLWDRFKSYKQLQQAIDTQPDGDSTKTEDKIIQEIAEDKFPLLKRSTASELEHRSNDLTDLSISEEEIQTALYKLRGKRYTGPEGIKFRVFLECSKPMFQILATICKMSFKSAHIPTVCRTTIGNIIPKKLPGKYRIVHIGTPLSSLLEQIALKRLEYRLEKENLINSRQFGFTALRGRHDLIARIIESAITHRIKHGSSATTNLVSLDIDGAFDNIDQDILIQKMRSDLNDIDDIHKWLTHFILNREIILKHKGHKATPRQVCKGVPQGSPLGPILWNYAINNIDGRLTQHSTTEALFYADDIILIHNNNPMEKLQDKLNCIIEELDRKKLTVNPLKSQILMIKLNNRDLSLYETPNIYINNQAIPKTNSLNVLGVTINSKLQLDRQADTTLRNLKQRISLLAHIRQLNFVHNHTEWRSLIHSFIISITVDNSFPILAIDKHSSNWMEGILVKSLKLIFGWSNVCSNKLTKLLTDITDIKILIRKQLTNRLGTEHNERYRKLLNALDNGQCWKKFQPTKEGLSEMSRHHLEAPYNRRYCNPNKIIKLKVLSEEKYTRPTWIIIEERNKTSVATLMINHKTSIRETAGRHEQAMNPYFNTIELIRKIIYLKHNKEKIIALQEKSAILSALKNASNNDGRIIYLRELIKEHNWTMVQMNHPKATKEYRDRKKKEGINHQDMQEETRSLQNYTRPIPVNDYITRSRENKLNKLLTESYFRDCHTKITATILEDTKTWRNMNPGWINSTKMLMLTGMVRNNNNGLLIFGRRRDHIQTHIGCSTATCGQQAGITSQVIRHNITEIADSLEAAVHRIFHCANYSNKQRELMNAISAANKENLTNKIVTRDHITRTLRNKRTAQTFIRLMAEAALSE